MSDRDPKSPGWRIAILVLFALLASGLLIFLAVQKVRVEEKVERKFSIEKNVPRPTPKFKPLESQTEPNN